MHNIPCDKYFYMNIAVVSINQYNENLRFPSFSSAATVHTHTANGMNITLIDRFEIGIKIVVKK